MASFNVKELEEIATEFTKTIDGMMNERWPADLTGKRIGTALAALMAFNGVAKDRIEDKSSGITRATHLMMEMLEQARREATLIAHILNRAQADVRKAQADRESTGFVVN